VGDEDKVAELKVVTAIGPERVEGQEAKLFPQQKPWWGMFRGKLVYLDKYSKVKCEI